MTAFLHFFDVNLLGFDQFVAEAFQVLLLAFDTQAQDDDGNGRKDQGKHIEDAGEIEAPGQQGPDHHRRRHAAKTAKTGTVRILNAILFIFIVFKYYKDSFTTSP